MTAVDHTIYSHDTKREATCRACSWDWADDGFPPAHSCRPAPRIPRATIEAKLREAEKVFADRELRIRREHLADITLSRGHAG